MIWINYLDLILFDSTDIILTQTYQTELLKAYERCSLKYWCLRLSAKTINMKMGYFHIVILATYEVIYTYFTLRCITACRKKLLGSAGLFLHPESTQMKVACCGLTLTLTQNVESSFILGLSSTIFANLK